MSNIQKAFKAKAKRGLCMAAGGVIEQNSRPLAAPVIQGNAADLIQNAYAPIIAAIVTSAGAAAGVMANRKITTSTNSRRYIIATADNTATAA